MNRIAPIIALCADLNIYATPLGKAETHTYRSSGLEDRVVCHPLPGIPPAPRLALPNAIAARLFASPNDTGCLVSAPGFAPSGGTL